MQSNKSTSTSWRNPVSLILDAARTNPLTWAVTGAVVTLAILSPVAGG